MAHIHTRCKNCGRKLPIDGNLAADMGRALSGFCSEGCRLRFEATQNELNRQEAQAQAQQAQEKAQKEAREQILFQQRTTAMRRDPRFKNVELFSGLFYNSDAELLEEYMRQYGDPLQNPSLQQQTPSAAPPSTPPTTATPSSSAKRGFFESDAEGKSNGSFFEDDDDLEKKELSEEQQNLVEVFVKLAAASMVDEMKAMLLQGKVDSSILCAKALNKLLSMAETSVVPKEVVELLLNFGDLTDENRLAVWPELVKFGYVDIAEKALQRGADIDADPAHWTALMYAITQQDTAMVELLLEKGADPNYFYDNFFADNDGIPPLSMAESAGNQEIIAMLKAKGAEPK